MFEERKKKNGVQLERKRVHKHSIKESYKCGNLFFNRQKGQGVGRKQGKSQEITWVGNE